MQRAHARERTSLAPHARLGTDARTQTLAHVRARAQTHKHTHTMRMRARTHARTSFECARTNEFECARTRDTRTAHASLTSHIDQLLTII